jgi:hypothetical protein
MGILRMAKVDDVPQRNEKVKKIDFCSLPLYEDQLVRIKARYSGVEEYWSISPLSDCSSDQLKNPYTISLDRKDYVLVFPWSFIKRNRLNKLYNNYWKYDSEIVIEGYFSSSSEYGYGHMNSYDSEFVVTYFRKIRLIKK